MRHLFLYCRGLFCLALLGPLLFTQSVQAQERTIRFSGYEWTLKSSDSMGPGPNAWSPDNVRVDEKGWLHLKISRKDGKWVCAEINSKQRFGFGTYEFEITGPIDRFDPNVVLGLFNYPTRDVGVDGTNEIDIEFARWGMPQWPIGNYTVWPPSKEAKNGSSTFSFHLDNDNTLQRFIWKSQSVQFQSLAESEGKEPEEIQNWLYHPEEPLRRIPQHPIPVLMNLWLFRGNAPTDGKEVEVIVRSFKFRPAAPHQQSLSPRSFSFLSLPSFLSSEGIQGEGAKNLFPLW